MDQGEGYSSMYHRFGNCRVYVRPDLTHSILDNSWLYLAGICDPYIHVILFYVVSITCYSVISQLLWITNPSISYDTINTG